MTHTHQNLKSYYASLGVVSSGKTTFARKIKSICEKEKCGCSLGSIYGWCKGDVTPKRAEHLEILSIETGIPIENLFSTDIE